MCIRPGPARRLLLALSLHQQVNQPTALSREARDSYARRSRCAGNPGSCVTRIKTRPGPSSCPPKTGVTMTMTWGGVLQLKHLLLELETEPDQNILHSSRIAHIQVHTDARNQPHNHTNCIPLSLHWWDTYTQEPQLLSVKEVGFISKLNLDSYLHF